MGSGGKFASRHGIPMPGATRRHQPATSAATAWQLSTTSATKKSASAISKPSARAAAKKAAPTISKPPARSSPTSRRTRGGLASPLQRHAASGAATCASERSAIPPSHSGAPAGVATALTAFFHLAAAAAAADAQPNGDMGASDSAAKATGASSISADAAASTRPAAHGRHGDSGFAGDAPTTARTGYQL